jgi:hypothetical protein
MHVSSSSYDMHVSSLQRSGVQSRNHERLNSVHAHVKSSGGWGGDEDERTLRFLTRGL